MHKINVYKFVCIRRKCFSSVSSFPSIFLSNELNAVQYTLCSGSTKKTNKWFILLMTLKLKKKRLKTVENESIANNGFRTKNPYQKFFFVIYSLKEFKFEDDCYGPVERNHIGSDTHPKLFLFWFDIYFCWLFFLNWYLFVGGKST